MDYDKTSIADTYAAARRLSVGTMNMWMDAVAEYFSPPPASQTVILDLGCGTGRLSIPLAERFSAIVVGVEPSQRMRSEAQAGAAHSRVSYLAGSAEGIPCDAACFDAAFLSMVVHHFRDLGQACRELWRVLKPGGLVFVRTDLPELQDNVMMYRFFPAARRAALERSPSGDTLRAQFSSAGFECLHIGARVQVIDPSLEAHYGRLKLRSLSTLVSISDAEFAEGLERLRQAAQAEDRPQPVREAIGFMVFRKPRENDK